MAERKKNQLKDKKETNPENSTDKENEGGKEKSEKPVGKEIPSPAFISSFLNRFQNERFQKILGLSLLLLSVYFFIAFTSFLFTWTTDYDQVSGS